MNLYVRVQCISNINRFSNFFHLLLESGGNSQQNMYTKFHRTLFVCGFYAKRLKHKQHVLRHFKRLCSNLGFSDIWSPLVVSISDISLYLVNFYVVNSGWIFATVYICLSVCLSCHLLVIQRWHTFTVYIWHPQTFFSHRCLFKFFYIMTIAVHIVYTGSHK